MFEFMPGNVDAYFQAFIFLNVPGQRRIGSFKLATLPFREIVLTTKCGFFSHITVPRDLHPSSNCCSRAGYDIIFLSDKGMALFMILIMVQLIFNLKTLKLWAYYPG